MSDDRLMRFVLALRQAGVTDARTLSALERTPRAVYAPTHLAGLALDDVALPLAHTQMMTKASIVGRVLAALAPEPGDSVLEIGTGSGYQAAAIAELAQKVVSLDRWRDIVANARERLARARQKRVIVHLADGYDGWALDAPYDRIVVNAAVTQIPPPLLDQLRVDGVLIAPVGGAEGQRLIRYRNTQAEDLGPVTFQLLERGMGDEPQA